MTQEQKIQLILDKMDLLFADSIGPNNRSEYMKLHNVQGLDWHFSLTADDIINKKIPRAVVGCTGIAKVFCKFADDTGLDCLVLTTARVSNMDAAAQDRAMGRKERIISGHQVIAVRDKKGILRAFDPGRKRLQYIDATVQSGGIIPFVFDGQEMLHRITAILSPTEYANVNTYKKLRDLYVDKKKQTFEKGKHKLNLLDYIKNIFIKENC